MQDRLSAVEFIAPPKQYKDIGDMPTEEAMGLIVKYLK
jgi:hypothetical protein